MPYLTTNDNVKIYYEDAGGNGIPVIFSHGFGSGSKLWRFQVPALVEAGLSDSLPISVFKLLGYIPKLTFLPIILSLLCCCCF